MMARAAMMVLLGLGAVVYVSAGACSTPPQSAPRDARSASLLDVETAATPSTPSTAAMPESTALALSPTQQAIVTREILVTPGFPPVQEAPSISQTLQAMVQYQHHLRNLTLGQPTGSDLVDMAQVVSGLSARVYLQMGQMTPTQRVQALQELRNLAEGMVAVVTTYILLSEELGPSVAMGTPEIIPGTPLTLINVQQPKAPTPFQAPSTSEILKEKIDKLRNQEMELAAGHPTGGDVVVVLESIGSVLTTTRQLAGSLPTIDLEGLTGGLAGAMGDLVGVMEAYVFLLGR